MKIEMGGMELVNGFTYAAVECGIRYENRLDYALIYSEAPCNAAGMFTTNKIFAAPVKLSRLRINNPVQAILINATNANACTGEEGYRNTEMLTADIAARLGLPAESVLMASTGVIGRQLPTDRMAAAHGRLVETLSRENGRVIPRAIMTTDTVEKYVCVSFPTSAGDRRIAGTAKGSGMIAPNMATLLAFLITDASVPKKDLDILFRQAVEKSLNAITIDGDMSTNDTALLLSPATGQMLVDPADIASFKKALETVLTNLAEKIIADGEGITKRVKVVVLGAVNDEDAKRIARSVSQSVLVKTALFGNDPNWGRIACAAGYSGAVVEESSLTVRYDDIDLLKNGVPIPFDTDKIKSIMARGAFTITVDIGLGKGEATMLTTDLSYDYVKINADYST